MPRKLRVHYTKAMHHVMHQGNYQQKIFYDKEDYLYAYKLLKRAVNQYGCMIHLFCLMSNHIHLLIQVDEVPLSKIMQSFGSAYANYLNKKMQRNGHLFRGRYKEKLVQDETYLLELCFYIHNNPLKAGIVRELSAYPWSSHHCYLKTEQLKWVTTNVIKKILKNWIQQENAYCFFIAHWRKESRKAIHCTFDETGNLNIQDSVNNKINATKVLDLGSQPLNLIIEIISDTLQVSIENIQSSNKREACVLARVLITYFAHYHGRYTLTAIANTLQCCSDTLSKTLRRHFSDERKRAKLNAKIKLLRRKLAEHSKRY